MKLPWETGTYVVTSCTRVQQRLNPSAVILHPGTVTMDPRTAHPRIRLSEDNSRLQTQRHHQPVKDHPGRFDVALAALGTTGHSSGRQFWEISVANQVCYHVGVASKAAQRKGTIQFKPATGYWTMTRNKLGHFRALDRVPAAVSVPTQPVTLGVFLDYSKGRVSFYDTGARSHLYSFTGQTFTDKLYPFIGLCEEDIGNQDPIQLLPPGPTDWIQ